jgi:hypothetical protein
MMPVLRVSDQTWKRLQSHARPFDDKPEDIVNKALDALDEKAGRVLTAADIELDDAGLTTPSTKGAAAKKLPQKEFRIPLMDTVMELGGEAQTSDVRRIMQEKMAPRLSPADYEFVSSGDPRWWNAICWERKALVTEGLFVSDSDRGVWKLSAEGKRFLDRGR